MKKSLKVFQILLKNKVKTHLTALYQTFPIMKKNDSEAIELARLYHKWVDYSTIACSTHTVRTYEYSFKLYIEFLEEQKKIRTMSFCMAENFSIKTKHGLVNHRVATLVLLP